MRAIGVLATVLALAGCGAIDGDDAGCASVTSQSTVAEIVKDAIEREEKSERTDDLAYSAAEFRAALGQVIISLADIRTDRKDPQSTKKFCTATIKIVFPDKVVTDADQVRGQVELGTVADLAEAGGLVPAANAFTTEISYNVQPTDDGSKLFAQVSGRVPGVGFVKEVLSSALLRPELASRQTATAQESTKLALENAAQEALALSAARAEYQQADAELNQTWRDLSVYDREQLLPYQRNWIARKARECRVEAVAAGVAPGLQELVRLGCESKMARERSAELLNGGIAAEE